MSGPYLRPARKVFNFRKKEDGARSGEKEGVVKLLPSLFVKKNVTMADVWAGYRATTQ